MKIRIGQGIDAHRFVEGRPLILGGVTIPHTHGLEGHSDADALTHAICDAMLGALGLGDIGTHFSDTDAQHKNRNSLDFLEKVHQWVQGKGYDIANIDSTLITEQPKLAPHISSMQDQLANTLKIFKSQVSIKATRAEKMGALGRQEGLLAMAIVLLEFRGL